MAMAEAEFEDGGRGDRTHAGSGSSEMRDEGGINAHAVGNGSGSGHANGHLPRLRPWPVTSIAAALAADGGSEMELRGGGDETGHGLRWKERVRHFTWTWFTVSVFEESRS